MDMNNPFETFQKTAFRLEALPQYLVDDEKDAFAQFQQDGSLPKEPMSDWSHLVDANVKNGKTMKRLRLISDKLTPYEQFELQIYSGIEYGEDIRLNARHIYAKDYLYDFWFFDDEYISQINYESDGTFIGFDTRIATDEEKLAYKYWLDVFEKSTPLT